MQGLGRCKPGAATRYPPLCGRAHPPHALQLPVDRIACRRTAPEHGQQCPARSTCMVTAEPLKHSWFEHPNSICRHSTRTQVDNRVRPPACVCMLTDGGEDREHDAIQADQLEVYELGQLDDVHRLVERQAVVRRRQALQIGMDMPLALLWGQAAGEERCRHLHIQPGRPRRYWKRRAG